MIRNGTTIDAETDRSELSVTRFRPTGLLLCCLLLLVSSVAWRRGSYFSGSFDVVVLVKAALTSLAAVLAWMMPRSKDAWAKVGVAPLFWLGAYLIISVLGGVLHGEGFASLVLACRVLLTAVTLLLLVLSHPWQAVISSLASAMVLLAGVGSVTGVTSIVETGRLYGGIPPLNANEICLLCSIPAVVLLWKVVHGRALAFEYLVLLVLLGTVWLTGARTGLAALIIAGMLLIAMAQRLATPLAVVMAACVPAMLWVTFFTPWVTKFASRGDPSNLLTLNSRTVAWQAAVDYPNSLTERLFGGGLALKQIPVTAAYRNSQILDSTWVSALIQVGVVGSIVLVLFLLATLVRALRFGSPQSHLMFVIVTLLTIVSVMESGLFDSTTAFVTLFTISLLVHRIRQARPSPVVRARTRDRRLPTIVPDRRTRIPSARQTVS